MFIGRDRELASARSQLSLPDVAGVVLVGDAGVGKSALAEAIVTGMDPVNAQRWRVIPATSVSPRSA